jgi:transposase
MARTLLTDEHWQLVEALLPPTTERRRIPGPRPIQARAVLTGILFVLKSGLPWEELPAEVGAGSGMTCLRRLRQWQREGVWDRIREALAGAFAPGEVDWKRADVPPRVRRPAVPRAQERAAPRPLVPGRGEAVSAGGSPVQRTRGGR